jgi:hypothetical protein
MNGERIFPLISGVSIIGRKTCTSLAAQSRWSDRFSKLWSVFTLMFFCRNGRLANILPPTFESLPPATSARMSLNMLSAKLASIASCFPLISEPLFFSLIVCPVVLYSFLWYPAYTHDPISESSYCSPHENIDDAC